MLIWDWVFQLEITIESLVSISLVIIVVLVAFFSLKSLWLSDTKKKRKVHGSQQVKKYKDSASRTKIIEAAEAQRKKTQKHIMSKFLEDKPEDAAKVLKNWLIDSQGKNKKNWIFP